MYGRTRWKKHTRTYTHTPNPVLLPPACCWNCFPPSSEPGKAGFIVLTYLCVKSDCSVLYLCLYSDGEMAERVREGGRGKGESGKGKKGGFVSECVRVRAHAYVWGLDCYTGARRTTRVRRMAGHLAPLWRIMTGCLAMTHPPKSFHSCICSHFSYKTLTVYFDWFRLGWGYEPKLEISFVTYQVFCEAQ